MTNVPYSQTVFNSPPKVTAKIDAEIVVTSEQRYSLSEADEIVRAYLHAIKQAVDETTMANLLVKYSEDFR